MSNYSKADTRSQWFQDNYPGATLRLTAETMVLVIHTTEGMTWPGYEGGKTAPNYTGLPPRWRVRGVWRRKGAWRAHFPDEKSSRALQNKAGGVETNTLNAVQIELIGTCNPAHRVSWNGQGKYKAGKDYVYWPNATYRQLKWLARLVADLHRRHGLQLVARKPFLPYPASYGNKQGQRMTNEQWRNAVGIVGHQHIPENSHGDPGDLDVARLIRLTKGLLAR